MVRWSRSWAGRFALCALVVCAFLAVPIAAQAVTPDVTGRVVEAGSGHPVANHTVGIAILPDSGQWDWTRETQTDANGYYSFSGLANGAYRIHVRGGMDPVTPQYFGETWTEKGAADLATATVRPAKVDITLPEVQPLIRGTVTDSHTGDGIAGAQVEVQADEFADGNYRPVTAVSTNAGGHYGLVDTDLMILGCNFKLKFTDPESGASEWWDNAASDVTATPIFVGYDGATHQADAQLDRPAPSLAGHITDEKTGEPIADGFAQIYRQNGAGWDHVTFCSANSLGAWKAIGLSAGTYRVVLHGPADPGYYDEAWNDHRGGVWVGDNIVLAAGGSVTGINAALTPKLVAGSDSFEPDNSRAAATSVTPDGTSGLHSIYPDGDVDWVKFPVRVGYEYAATGIGVNPDAIGLDLVFFDAAGNPIEGSTYAPSENGIAYLKVSSTRIDTPSDCWYQLSVSAKQQDRATISGTIKADDTDLPIKGVTVRLLRYNAGGGAWQQVDSAATSQSGGYSFTVISSQGPFRLMFDTQDAPGYLPEYFNDVSNVDGAQDIGPAPGETYVADAGLASAGQFRGTVTAQEDDQPLWGIAVVALRYNDSTLGYDAVKQALTDGWGHYSLGQLDPAGQYIVRFSDSGASGGNAYQTEWYDNAYDEGGALPLYLGGGEVKTLDAALALDPDTGHVRGRVTDRATGRPIEGIKVTYSTGTEGSPSYATGDLGVTNADGEYRKGGLAPTEVYTIRFSDDRKIYFDQYYDDQADSSTAEQVALVQGAWIDANAKLDRETTPPTVSAEVNSAGIVGGWRTSPATVTITATDDLSGVASKKYRIGSGKETTYTTPFAVPSGEVVVTCWATDNAGNASDQQTLTVRSDGDRPVTSATATSARTSGSWRSSPTTITLLPTDSGSGVSKTTYQIGSGKETTYTAPVRVTAGNVTIGYWSVDKLGNVEAKKTVSVSVDSTAPSTPTGLNTSAVTNASVVLGWTASTDVGSGVGSYDVYRNGAKVANVTGTSYQDTGLAIGSSHTYTVVAFDNVGNASAASAGRGVLVSPNPTTLAAGFGASADIRSQVIVAYKGSATIVGILKDFEAAPLASKAIAVEAWNGTAWVKVGDALASATTAGEYRFSAAPSVKTTYRMVFAADPHNAGATSRSLTVLPKASVGTPKSPKITLLHTRYYTLTGTLSPKHAKGTAVRIYRWRNGKKLSGYVTAKVTSTGTYSIRMKLSKTGKWKLRAYHADAGHAASYSGYRSVTVK